MGSEISGKAFFVEKLMWCVKFLMDSFSSTCNLSKIYLWTELFSALKCWVRNWKKIWEEVIESYSWCSAKSCLAWSSRDYESLNESCLSFMLFMKA